MASSFSLLTNLINLLRNNLNVPLDTGMSGLDLVATLPTRVSDLPTIVVSFAKIQEESIGLGGIVEVRRELTKDTKVIKADRVAGEMIFHIWIKKRDTDVLTKIDQAAGLLSDLLEEYKNELRSQGLLKKELILVGRTESSKNEPVWLIRNTEALGRGLVYNFVYEYVAEEEPTEGVIDQVRVDEIWLDGTLLTETMVISRE
ncbi:MAG: hypothetical protein ACFFCW_00175 [Candidatus Hodarchaeota archaeon]